MSDLKPVGIRAVAEGAAEYLATLQRMEEATNKYAASLSPAVAAMNRLDSVAGGAGKELSDLAKDEKTAASAAGDLGDKSEAGGKGLNILQQAAIGATRRLGELAINGAQQAAAAVLQFAKDGIKAAGDFESGMNNFAAATGSSLEQAGLDLGDFKDLFISLGRDLPVSTAEVQQAAIEMAKGGIEPATIAAGGLRDTLQFAAAGGLSLAEAAEIAAKAVGGWTDVNADAAEKAAFLAHAEDLMARAANASTVDVSELAGGLYNVQGAARAAGVSFDDTVTTLAAVSSSFKSSFTAGTSFTNFIARIQPTTDKAAQAMARLGLLTEKGTSKFYDATGAFIGMRQASDLLKKATDGLSDAEKSATLQTIFGNDAKGIAVKLAELGAEGYDKMAAAMAATAGVEEQAALKQQGFNTAVDNMMGSLEAFQITVGSAVLPALTNLIGLLSSGINVLTNYADATLKGETALSTIAGVISDYFLPALAGVTAALVLYATVQMLQAIPAILTSIPAIAAQTAAFFASAEAVAAAIAPYALIAIAIAGVVKAYTDFNNKVTDATTALLNSRQWWLDSTAAIDDYAKETGAAKDALSPLNASIVAMRTQIQGEIEDLGRRSAAGLLSEKQYNDELAAINQHKDGLRQATDAYESQRTAILKATTAQITATAAAAEAKGPLADLGDTASLTAEDIDKLTKSLQDTYQKGQAAVQSYASTQSEFLSDVEQRQRKHADTIADLEAKKQKATSDEQRKGIDDQIKAENEAYLTSEQNAAASYARQQAAQKQHLGQMLIDYTVAQAQLGNIGKDKAAEITSALEKEYGLQESSVASTFLKMAGSIDEFAASSSGSVEGLISTLHDQQTQAADTQKAMDDYAKEYTATAVANFVEKKGEAKDYIAALEDIPNEVQSKIETPGIYERDQEIDEIKRSIDRIPRHVTVTIDVKDNRPEDIIPHSPTAFETGIRGIIDAVTELSQLNGFDVMGESAERTLGIVQDIAAAAGGMFGDLADISRQEISNMGALERLGASRLKTEEELAKIKKQAETIAETDPEKAKAYYQLESKHAIERGQMEDSQIKAQQEYAAALAAVQKEGLDVSQAQYEAEHARLAEAEAHLKVLQQQSQVLREAQQKETAGFGARYAAGGTGGLTGLAKQLQDLLFAPETPGVMNDLTGVIGKLYDLIAAISGLPHREMGGPVAAAMPYIVGENGPEIFRPRTAGQILPSFAQMGANGGRSTVTSDNSRTVNMPVYVSQTPNLGQSAAIIQAMLT